MHLPQTTLQRLLQQGTNETAEFGINVLQPIEKQEEYDVENRMSGRTIFGGVAPEAALPRSLTSAIVSTIVNNAQKISPA